MIFFSCSLGFRWQFYQLDLDCISSLVTFEHLSLMCRHPERQLTRSEGRAEDAPAGGPVTVVPFCFQLPRLLPKCDKAKILFSTFVQGAPSLSTRCSIDIELLSLGFLFPLL